MIRKSFVILPGVSFAKEKSLWMQGIKDWHDFRHADSIIGITKKMQINHIAFLHQASSALRDNNSNFFCHCLPQNQTWRLYQQFKKNTGYLDIETSGVNGYLTCMTISDDSGTKTMVRGINFNPTLFAKIIQKYSFLVTFNGNVFDLPFLKKYLDHSIPKVPCWDLRHSCHSLGFKGGLKDIEKQFNIKRNNVLVDRLKGGDPISLWRMYQVTGDTHYLDILVEYNQEDAINLEILADKLYAMHFSEYAVTQKILS